MRRAPTISLTKHFAGGWEVGVSPPWVSRAVISVDSDLLASFRKAVKT